VAEIVVYAAERVEVDIAPIQPCALNAVDMATRADPEKRGLVHEREDVVGRRWMSDVLGDRAHFASFLPNRND
jgi:hypothetical protein